MRISFKTFSGNPQPSSTRHETRHLGFHLFIEGRGKDLGARAWQACVGLAVCWEDSGVNDAIGSGSA